MNKWKCVMTAGITALFDGCMLRCLITGAPAQKDATEKVVVKSYI